MRRVAWFLAVALSWGCVSAAGSTLKQLVDAEHAFAAAAAEQGMRDAFLGVMTDDAILFRPQPVNGKKWFVEQPAPPGVLGWDPVHAELSRGGDLGYTTGPWRYKSDDPQAVPAFGHYVSIWSRSPEGEWKLVLDIGTGHHEPPASSWEPQMAFSEREVEYLPAPSSIDRWVEQLLEAEQRLSSLAASKGPAKAYESAASPRIRLYRQGVLPVVGWPEVKRTLEQASPLAPTTSTRFGISNANDLGFTYGTAVPAEGSTREAFSYLRIWRQDKPGTWKVVIDVALPLPAAGAGS